MKMLGNSYKRIMVNNSTLNNYFNGVAVIAPWFYLRLPSCVLGFKSQAHHLRFFQFVLLKLYQENNKNKQREAGLAHFWQLIQLIENLIKQYYWQKKEKKQYFWHVFLS